MSTSTPAPSRQPKSPLTRDVIESFLADVSSSRRPNTIIGFRSTLLGATQQTTRPRHGSPITHTIGMKRLHLVTADEWIHAFNACHPDPHHSASSKKRGAAAYNGLLKHAFEHGHITEGVYLAARRTGFKVNRRERRPWLKPEQIGALETVVERSAFDDYHRFVYRFFVETGVRPMELRAARRRDLDLDARTLHIPHGKGSGDGKSRMIPVSDEFISVWSAHARRYGLKPEHHVAFHRARRPVGGASRAMEWVYDFRKPIGDTTIGTYFASFAEEFAAAVREGSIDERLEPQELTPRTLRRSYACLQLILDAYHVGGLTIHQLSRVLGHESVSTTEIYLSDVDTYIGRDRRPTDVRAGLALIAARSMAEGQAAVRAAA